MPFDPSAAREAGRKSGEARRRRAAPDAAARDALLRGAADAAGALGDVVRGVNGFEEARPETRVKAAMVILEYVLGKPRGLDAEEAPEAEMPAADLFAALLSDDYVDNPPESGEIRPLSADSQAVSFDDDDIAMD